MLERNKIYCGDCLELMKEIPDKSIDLVLTDPPYGIVQNQTKMGGEGVAKNKIYPKIKWDKKPQKIVFDNILRISKNQIIFGGNYFSDLLPISYGWYCWDKQRPKGTTFSEFELIWTSFEIRPQLLRYMWNGMLRRGDDIIEHPTQKPEALISFLLNEHSLIGDLILDPFLGSGTTAVECKSLKRDFIGIEINPKYVEIARKRLKHVQMEMFL